MNAPLSHFMVSLSYLSLYLTFIIWLIVSFSPLFPGLSESSHLPHFVVGSTSPANNTSTPIVILLCLRSRIGLWEKHYYALFDVTHYFFFQCGVYKYCYSVYGTVWCEDKVRSANCVRTVTKHIGLLS